MEVNLLNHYSSFLSNYNLTLLTRYYLGTIIKFYFNKKIMKITFDFDKTKPMRILITNSLSFLKEI